MKTIDYHNVTDINTSKKVRRRWNVGDIWENMAKCLVCEDIIRSRNRHDYVTCKCGNLSVDGGSWYLRRGFKKDNSYEELSISYKDVK